MQAGSDGKSGRHASYCCLLYTSKATVTVTKDEHNKLSASVAYTVDGKPIDEASYENIYTLPEPVSYTHLDVYKRQSSAGRQSIRNNRSRYCRLYKEHTLCEHFFTGI